MQFSTFNHYLTCFSKSTTKPPSLSASWTTPPWPLNPKVGGKGGRRVREEQEKQNIGCWHDDTTIAGLYIFTQIFLSSYNIKLVIQIFSMYQLILLESNPFRHFNSIPKSGTEHHTFNILIKGYKCQTTYLIYLI